MISLTFITQGFEVGYGPDGFFAFGATDNHKWDEREWPGHALPRLSGKAIEWRIDMNPKGQWGEFRSWLSENQVGPRVSLLEDFWKEFGYPAGRLWKSAYEPHSPVLSYSLPHDPSLAAFIMGVVGAGREMAVCCPGFSFVDEDKVAPAVSLKGFEERSEPAFTCDVPILRVK